MCVCPSRQENETLQTLLERGALKLRGFLSVVVASQNFSLLSLYCRNNDDSIHGVSLNFEQNGE